jgi:phosphofructokinase-like protein
MSIKRVAVSTGGGDCPGLNAVIRGLVRAGVNRYGWEFLGIEDGLQGLIEPNKLTDLTMASVRGILPRGGTILGTSNKGNPFRYAVQHEGREVETDISDEVVARLHQLGVDCLVMIGGDGTMTIAQGLREKGINVVGIPKTIDNDLAATDYTFGFDTACNIAMEALDRLHTTAESHDRVMLLEVMGRHAGHIALHAGLAGGADVILVPEIPYRTAAVLRKINTRIRAGTTFTLVVVAEGARPEGGDFSFVEKTKPGTAKRLGGAAQRVAESILAEAPHLDVRVTVLGHLQRGGSPSHFDRVLATRFGVAAARLVAREGFGRMVCLRGLEIEDVDIKDAIAVNRGVDIESPAGLVSQARALGISFGDELDLSGMY